MATFQKLSVNEAVFGDFTNKAVIFGVGDVTAAGATNVLTFALGTLAANHVVGNFAIYVPVEFTSSDGTLASLAITIGDSGSNNWALASTEILASGSYKTAATSATPAVKAYTTATAVNVYFTATAAKNLSTITAGELHVFWTQRLLSQLAYPQAD